MIRIATEADVPQILDIYAPYILTTTCTFEYDVPSRETFLQRFQTLTRQFPWLVWEEDGKILGYAYGSAPFERAAYGWCSESSVYLRPQVQGKGIGRKLCLALEALLAAQGYIRNYVIITSENAASLAFHQKLGYRLTARMPGCGLKFGKWLGITWMEKQLNSVGIPSNPPIPWSVFGKDVQRIFDILDTLSLS